MNNYQLSGQRGTPVAQTPTGLIAVAVLFILALVAYGGWKLVSAHATTTKTASVPESATNAHSAIPDERIEDFENHLHHMQALIVSIEEKERTIHKNLSQVSPVLQQNYLSLEHRRLDNADRLSESVLRDAGEALDEIELAKQNLASRR